MSCNNCFNGCAETVSDQCVKYTGLSIPGLGITTGDSLSSVELAITDTLTTILDGSGIVPAYNHTYLCSLVTGFLPEGTVNLNDIINALIQSACTLQDVVLNNTASINTLNANYTIGCLTGVTSSTDTHDIVQAVINKLCSLQLDVTALALDLETNYISVSNINSYIAAYLASIGASTLISNKMVPYSILPFYGDLNGKFDSTGAGIGDWARIFLCNGNNPGVPDLRGRVPVGVTAMSGGSFPAQTDPSITGNPNYSTKGIATFGTNQVTLNATQIPAHTHTATVTINDPGHNHTFTHENTSGNTGSGIAGGTVSSTHTTTVSTGLTGLNGTNVIVSNASAGGGLSHSNVQPVISVYYIIYIP